MRLWSLHPTYLDARGLVALWREALLAQRVLSGTTRGYRHHPQLQRFAAHPNPERAIAAYLYAVFEESQRRRYRFDPLLIRASKEAGLIQITTGQLEFERSHLLAKLWMRDAACARVLESEQQPRTHPSFNLVPGPVATWERAA